MRNILLVSAAAVALAGCNQNSVSLTNASPEEVAKAAKDSGISFTPGEWETTVEIVEAEIPGMPKGAADQMMQKGAAKTQKHSYCMSAEEASHPGAGLLTGEDQKKSKCTIEKFSMSGGHIEQTVSCPDPDGKVAMRMVTTGNYTPTSMNGTASMDMDGFMKMKIRANISSRRVGECKPGAK